MLNLFLLTGALLQTSTSGLSLQENPPVVAQITVTSSTLLEENIKEGTRLSTSLHSGLMLEIQSSLDDQFELMVTSLDLEFETRYAELNSIHLRTAQTPSHPIKPYPLQAD
ncbi:hypothetical protein [Shewanella violacea]|uniref:Uncharacterized protein n=1 Tax=Shewanella violacea (strain JCM 10179 / CIP 106290 / LMG 19151 / DSS12) TaxID=637905 RepID=D4ZKS6_SHEVD|nr:hypothetical protein [Shewanella violacea]BAJ02275.1 hypothetical protein SVI_2304 [Shewanella violacea DSS12]